MAESVVAEITRLRGMSIGELRVRYAEVYGEEPRSRNKDYLWKRIAYRIQELAEGGISERAQRRAEELARDADLRSRPPKEPSPDDKVPVQNRDARLPAAGTTMTRRFRGKDYEVKILEKGFEFDGRQFVSLSAVAREISGTRWNGFLFFGLDDLRKGVAA